MRILNAEFIRSIVTFEKVSTDSLPEICFVGRSNVGKSSMINNLAGRKIARTSSTPGATRIINLFKAHYESEGERKDIIFSDFPGFGYSKVSRAESQNWKKMIEEYILKNNNIKKIVWLFDIRRKIDPLDTMLVEWFFDNKFKFCLVLTKSDKEKQSNIARKKQFFSEYLKGVPIFLFSSKTGKGKKELLTYIVNS